MLRARLILPLVAILALTGFFFLRSRPVSVRTARAEPGDVVQVVYATGSVRPDTETRVAAEAAGRVVALLVDEGDSVQAGQVVARLDDTAARIRLREIEGRLATSRARLTQMEAPTDPFDVRRVAAQARGAEQKLRGASDRVRAASSRVDTVSETARATELAVESALARVRALKNSAQAAQSEIEAARQRLDAARSEVQQARANLDAARDMMDRRRKLLQDGAVAERLVTEARTSMEGADAGLRAAQSRAQAAEQGVVTARANAEAAQSQVEDALAGVETARAQAAAARAQVAETRNAIPELEREVDARRQELEAQRSVLGQARRGARSVEVDVLRTEVQTQLSAVAQAREDLAKFTVRSPVTGRVTDRPVDIGDFLPAGGRLFTVASEQRLYVQADVDEADIGLVRLGATAHFQVDSQPGRSYDGRVSRIGREADPSTKTYPVEVRELRDTSGLRLGMTTDVNIEGRTLRDALLVPTAALQTDQDKTVVWVVGREQRVRRRPVRIKAKDNRTVQILEGLRPGEQVVRDPSGLTDDQIVELIPESDAAGGTGAPGGG